MKSVRAAALGLALVFAPIAMPTAASAGPVNYAQLTTMITNMGYAPTQISKDAAKPKMEIQTKAGTFNVPLGIEVSPSGRFVWISANLGSKTIDGVRAINFLKRGGSVQPTQFWISSSGNLFAGIAMDNRDITPANLRFTIDKLGADIAATADLWNF